MLSACGKVLKSCHVYSGGYWLSCAATYGLCSVYSVEGHKCHSENPSCKCHCSAGILTRSDRCEGSNFPEGKCNESIEC